MQWIVLASEAGGGGPSAALALGAALVLALVHAFGGKLTFLDTIPRSRWLSGAGGASVAYVFVHVLPELEAGGRAIEGSDLFFVTFFEHHVYLVALVGFVAFYGLERLAREQRAGDSSGESNGNNGGDEGDRGNEGDEASGNEADGGDENDGNGGASSDDGKPSDSDGGSAGDDESGNRGVFWIHVGSFTVYNGLIGRLLLHQGDLGTLLTFTVAIGLHFVVNDYGLREIHGGLYHRVGRWLLAGAVLVGAAIGIVTEIGEALFATVFAFVAGGIVLNVIKEELPAERESRFPAFAIGAAGYTALLLAI